MLHSSWRRALRRLAISNSPRLRRPAPLGRDNRLEDRVVPATVALLKLPDTSPPLLKAPAMPDISGLDAALIGAIKRAWELPPGTATNQWVIGLAPGQDPAVLSSLGANVATVNGWDNTYAAKFPVALDVAGAGPQLASFGMFAYPLISHEMTKRFVPNDPLFPKQWHLRNTGQTGGVPGADAHVVGAWENYTGLGSVIGIVDDGLQHSHPDLGPNYDAADSYDFNGNDPDPDPD
ncbi:MAG TPA: S8 family serine peptidase, partial [Gemmataceae bacterium]|nr:S8 family serine peptidase [Gemmataceae bacterium]